MLGSCSLHEAPPVDASPPTPDAAIDAPPPPDAMRLACSTAGLSCGGSVTMFTCGGNCWVRCTGNVSYNTARTACTGWMGALGEIDDATEQGCVAARLGGAAAWIGLVQSNTATKPDMGWTWNGTTPLSYTNWQSGKPDDGNGIEGGAEQCGGISPDGTWDDQACSSQLDFLCERP